MLPVGIFYIYSKWYTCTREPLEKNVLKKLFKTPVYLVLWFFHFSFCQSYLPFIFSSFLCDSCGLYSLYAITSLFTLYLSIFCHTVNLLELRIFCSHLPHRAISSYSWQSCTAECFWSWADFELAISSIKQILCRVRALLLLSGHNAQNNAICLYVRNSPKVAAWCNTGQLL